MNISSRDVQRLLTAAGYYKGGIDGDIGPKTYRTIDKIIEYNIAKVPKPMSAYRRKIAAVQLILDAAGHEPGPIDGYYGHNTDEAFNAWAYERAHGERENARSDVHTKSLSTQSRTWPRQSRVLDFYGSIGKHQTRIKLPYNMRLAWDTDQSVSSMTCHKRVANAMSGIFERTLDHYGKDRIRELRLDLFGGCLNVRKMRGGSKYSMHSWGIAVDLDPANNRLRWGRNKARLASSDYNDFWSFVEEAGAVSLGRAHNFDWMHFQFARV